MERGTSSLPIFNGEFCDHNCVRQRKVRVHAAAVVRLLRYWLRSASALYRSDCSRPAPILDLK
jgi:hypothetical protein